MNPLIVRESRQRRELRAAIFVPFRMKTFKYIFYATCGALPEKCERSGSTWRLDTICLLVRLPTNLSKTI